ncbi:universal stress protein [Herminiimonas fonticola]|uniref:Universal stress protein n=1 Tax=Herminiimonas fonticola TaxID=303380 RepID=A0A4R6GGA0_9BURK|nr:universal stress protein [Herminiimonas fonticola]RBA24769.1 Universal stress protein UspA and related nucleotide-binding protein [Herminiimonas fonticola]TDN93883.1 nucleotide-binding universal stress UspA family protein [Herminiimonas fonticola]
MFKHILLPTDGSPLSEIAIQKSISLAKTLGAKVTGLYVIPEYHTFTWQTEMLIDTSEDYAKFSLAQAEKFLAVIRDQAKEAGVTVALLHVISEHPYEAIIKVADDNQCDLITMASHGRKGVQGFLIGSETQKVLVHSKIPVLVYR